MRQCETCGRARAHFGLAVGARAPGERACRWCRGCAKQHPGAVDALAKKCEACALKHYLKRGTALSI